MADQKQRPRIRLQCILEQFERFDVEIVGRLVEHQQIGGQRKQSREQQPVAFAAGKHFHRRIGALRRKQKVTEVREHVLAATGRLYPFRARADGVRQRALGVELRAHLVEVRRLQLGAESDPPLVRRQFAEDAAALKETPIHPMRLVHELQGVLSDDITLCLDMGSFHIWLARHLYSFRARQVLITNGQQTLGVALPWAIAACLVRPGDKVMSISGDGGFLFSAAELETAVRLKCNLVHLVWIDGAYDMVRFQEMSKYGRASGVDFGPVDVVRFAEAFGARGLRIERPDEIAPTLRKALEMQGPVLVGVPVDYRDNVRLMEIVHPGVLN